MGFDIDPRAAENARERGLVVHRTVSELVGALATPRIIWCMTPPGPPTESGITNLKDLLASGDLVIDGGNSDFRDSLRLAADLKKHGITFVDVGVSGGIQGAKTGCGLLVGADSDDFERLKPLFETLAAPGAFVLVGRSGAGHFTKAVHNGVEYAIMQAYGEGYELLLASDIGVDILATLGAWQSGCSIRSHLLDKLLQALRPDPNLAGIRGYAADSGMGRWTVEEAIRLRVPTPTISAALQARFRSQQNDSPAMKSIAALRRAIGGHAVLESVEGA
jgi:6-phosphogluconate dehydrogenase